MSTFATIYLVGLIIALILVVALTVCEYVEAMDTPTAFIFVGEDLIKCIMAILSSWFTVVIAISMVFDEGDWIDKTIFTIKPKSRQR
jgi:hypothetical protein